MNRSDFAPNAPGELVQLSLMAPEANPNDSPVLGFVPSPLPPDIVYDEVLATALGDAMFTLGRLDKTASDLPNPAILVRPFLRREAILSSRIEGTQAELNDILLVEEAGGAASTVDPQHRETANYLQALEYGLTWIEERPISTSLLRDLHRLLLDDVSEPRLNPGAYRTGNVYLGGSSIRSATFVPGPPEQIPSLIDELMRFVDQPGRVPPLVQIAFVHYQFEAIHPFNDGNGRVGRLLISIMLKSLGIMRSPAVDLSAHVYAHRDAYVDGLRRVSTQGDWQRWLLFVIETLGLQAADANRRALKLLHLRAGYLRLDAKPRSASLDRWEAFIDALFERQTMTARRAEKLLGVSFPTAQRVIAALEQSGALVEITGQAKDRVWAAEEIAAILEETG
jgi:Fic family protein